MQNAASMFPLTWMARGMRRAFRSESFANFEQNGSWEFPLVALNLAIWLVVGLVLSRVRRWATHRDQCAWKQGNPWFPRKPGVKVGNSTQARGPI